MGLEASNNHRMCARLVHLIDDDLFFPAKLTAALAAAGIGVRTFDDGDIEAAMADLPACIVVNWGRAAEARANFVRNLKATAVTRDIPVLAFAGHLETTLHRLAKEAGADKVVANSAIASRPVQLIEELIARGAGMSGDVAVEE